MAKMLVHTGRVLLLITLLLALALPSCALAAGQSGATPVPEPTTLGQVSVKTSPTMYFMLIGASILGVGGMLIFLRYK
ncbi:hypothetical protein [Methanocella sp. MCL-LM]|uniref:hypothetical protein n=1 Tax=Methanocella sp. MCL-LM TaxID=3412035 RepID=UPI003C741712